MKKNSVFVFTAVLYAVGAGALAYAQAPQSPARPAGTAPTAGTAQPAPAAQAPAAIPTRLAVINLSDAMAHTKEGMKATAELNNKFGPKKAEYEKRQTEIDTLTDKLNKGQATLSDDVKRQLAGEIQSKTTSLKRFREDSQTEVDNDEAKITGDIQSKMGPILQNYAIQNGIAAVLDVGSQQTPVLWSASAINITEVIVALYDQLHPVKDEPIPTTAKTPPAPPKK